VENIVEVIVTPTSIWRVLLYLGLISKMVIFKGGSVFNYT
jgi:hypothetical protein